MPAVVAGYEVGGPPASASDDVQDWLFVIDQQAVAMSCRTQRWSARCSDWKPIRGMLWQTDASARLLPRNGRRPGLPVLEERWASMRHCVEPGVKRIVLLSYPRWLGPFQVLCSSAAHSRIEAFVALERAVVLAVPSAGGWSYRRRSRRRGLGLRLRGRTRGEGYRSPAETWRDGPLFDYACASYLRRFGANVLKQGSPPLSSNLGELRLTHAPFNHWPRLER